MTSPKFRAVGLLAAAAIALGACGNAVVTLTGTAVPSPTPAVTETPTPSPTPIVTPAPSPTPTPAPTPVVVGTVPVNQLLVAGQLSVCSDMGRSPQAFVDAAGNPTGSDVDLAREIAKRLGLQAVIVPTATAKAVTALHGAKCDVVMSGQGITAALLAQVSMIPYFHAGQAFVVAAGNPGGIKTVYDLCGKAVGARKGTAAASHLSGTAPYNSAVGLTARCQAARLAAISVKTYVKDSDAMAAIAAKKLDAYFADSIVAGNLAFGQPDQLTVAPGLVLDDAMQAMSLWKDKADLYQGVWNALESMIQDGTYLEILKKYGADSGAITADQLVPD